MKTAIIPPVVLALMLAGCDSAEEQDTLSGTDNRRADGEVLGGSVSDAMLPLDQLRSQSPAMRNAPRRSQPPGMPSPDAGALQDGGQEQAQGAQAQEQGAQEQGDQEQRAQEQGAPGPPSAGPSPEESAEPGQQEGALPSSDLSEPSE